MSSVSVSLKKMSNNVSKSYTRHLVKNKNVNYGVIGLLILLIIATPLVPVNVLALLKNNVVRVALIVLICVVCLIDPIKALLLAILFVVAIQRLHSVRAPANNAPVPVDSVAEPVKVEEQPVNISREENKILNLSGNNLNNVINVDNLDIENINDVDALPANVNNVANVDNVANVNNVANVDNVDNVDNVNNVINVDNVDNNVENVDNVVSLNNNNVSNNVANNVVANNVDDLQLNSVTNLSNNMNVLSNADNIAADVIGVNNRNARSHNSISGYNQNELINVNRINESNLLMDGTPEYNLVNNNKLSGEYSNNVIPNNERCLNMAPVNANNVANNDNNVANNDNNVANDNVGPNNTNNLINKNPYPGNNLNLERPHVPASLNVDGYNNQAVKYLQVGGVIQEGFQNETPENAANNAANNVANNVANNAANNADNSVVVPQNLLFTSSDQLRKAQDRGIKCDGKPNNAPVVSGNVMFSAQGYGHESGISGYNKYGASAINYLCVDK